MIVHDGDLETNEETFIKKWLVCLEFFIYKLINSYLPIQLESTNKTHRKLQINSHKVQKEVQMKKVKMKTPSFHLSSLPSLMIEEKQNFVKT